ncbi:MAG: DsbA family protein [Alphaproteobacteria bacterium]|nr:DsbA family protein [Alphaproteobacteria bacterium]
MIFETSRRFWKTSALMIGTLGVLGGLYAAPAHAEDFAIKSKDELNALIKEFLLDNPEVIFESVEKHRMAEEEKAQKDAMAKIKDYTTELTAVDAPSVGSTSPDVTIVEFFDYNCGYCKRALPDIQKLVKEDPKVRVVFKEMAILGPSSKTAALWSLAAHKQGKYFEYHVALMNHRGAKDEAALMQLGKDAGLDVEKLKADANDPATEKMLEHDMDIARDIGANGTPAFIIGSQFIPGYVGEEGLKSAIAEERQKAGN